MGLWRTDRAGPAGGPGLVPDAARGAAWPASSWPPANGSTGTTPNGCIPRSVTSHPTSTNRCSTLNTSPARWLESTAEVSTERPRAVHCPLWTRDGLGLPVDVECIFGEAGSFDGWRVLADRPDDGDRVISRCTVNRLGCDVAAVEVVLGRRQLLFGQRGMDSINDADVLVRSRCGDDVHDEVRALLVAGLSLMVLVPDPFRPCRVCG